MLHSIKLEFISIETECTRQATAHHRLSREAARFESIALVADKSVAGLVGAFKK